MNLNSSPSFEEEYQVAEEVEEFNWEVDNLIKVLNCINRIVALSLP